MCAPIAIAAGLALAGGALAGKAAKDQGSAEQDYYNHLSDNAERQAKGAVQQAQDQVTAEQDNAARETNALKQQNARVEGSQKAALAASGVGLNSVTAEDIAGDTFDRAKLDELAIRYNADRRSVEAVKAGKEAAYNLRDQAYQYRKAGANAKHAGDIQMYSSLLGGAGSVATKFMGK